MTDKELRKLRRDDLLQILINQQRQIDELNAQLQAEREALANRNIAIQESGTLAEALLKMNGVYEAAQSAADEYLRQMRDRADALVADAEKRSAEAARAADGVLSQAKAEAERIVARARPEAEALSRQPQPPAGPLPRESGGVNAGDEGEEKRKRWRLWGSKGS